MLYGLVLWRYRNLIPLMFAFMVLESCFGFVVGAGAESEHRVDLFDTTFYLTNVRQNPDIRFFVGYVTQRGTDAKTQRRAHARAGAACARYFSSQGYLSPLALGSGASHAPLQRRSELARRARARVSGESRVCLG